MRYDSLAARLKIPAVLSRLVEERAFNPLLSPAGDKCVSPACCKTNQFASSLVQYRAKQLEIPPEPTQAEHNERQ